MLSREDNERLVRVGPGTPMGALMRLYWIPFLLRATCSPTASRTACACWARTSWPSATLSGRVGLVDHACPHRGAPMVFARNEDDGLRCMYHGWKFAVDGSCQEIAGRTATARRMCRNVRIKAYPVRERHGVLWAWMGRDAARRRCPSWSGTWCPTSTWRCRCASRNATGCRRWKARSTRRMRPSCTRVDAAGTINQWRQAADLMPAFECVVHDAGVHIASAPQGR
jgi:phthalate 4,5-dioxygenase oxygenase subunit